MSDAMKKQVDAFCEALSNLDDLHHACDQKRLTEMVHYSMIHNEEIPYQEIKEQLSQRDFGPMNHGTVESFMKKCEEFIKWTKCVLGNAQSAGLLK